MYGLNNLKRNNMKETTKEAAERMSTRVMEILFKDEKKLQQERSYSEEEVIAFGEFIFKNTLLVNVKGVEGILEQFKKK
jgi:hypothetical protein